MKPTTVKKILHLLFAFISTLAMCLAALLPDLSAAAQEPQPGRPEQAAAQAAQLTQAGARIAYHAQTGKVRFIGADPAQPLAQPAALAASASASEAALGFLAVYGDLFGLQQPAQELTVERSRTLEDGRSVSRFQQVYQDIPVLGGELIVQTTAANQVLAVTGEVLPDIAVSTTPSISAEAARQAALDAVQKTYGLAASGLQASEPALWIFNPVLIQPGSGITRLVWRLEVTSSDDLLVRELVLVDAQRGGVALHFNQVDTALSRSTYTANNSTTLPGTLVCNESNPDCTGGDTHAVAAHKYARDTYNFYSTYHGRDSVDNAGMTLVSTVHYGSNYANAGWDGNQMIYGDAAGYPLGDDVVAHELSHGVTQYESNLFYYYQSGAINESFSDVWGEFVDLVNGAGTDTSAVRWLMGEDITGLGAIRNMQNPPAFSDPDKMTSANYYTGSSDNGGVHTNSGINNKAAALMTDGGTFNGYTITGLGITKVAAIYYEVQTNLFTSGSDYGDLYEDLYQACLNKVGSAGITSADCQQVRNTTLAVEMNQQPVANFNPDAEICATGTTPVNTFFDDLESGFSNWTLGALSGTNFWTTTDPWGPYTHSGSGVLYADDYYSSSNAYAAMANAVTIPSGAYLLFFHAFDTESSYDGGVIEYSANGGAWTSGSSLIDSGKAYNGAISALSGQQGFTGSSHGYVSTRLNLSSLAGKSVKFRWRMVTDPGGYVWGWWVDDVRIYTCSSTTVQFNSPTYNVTENGGSATITAILNAVSSNTVTVNYATSNGSAAAGSDYTAASGTLTFSPGATSQTFSVPITNDTLDEDDETISIALGGPTNASLGTQSSTTLTILDNDAAPTVQFSSANYSASEGAGSAAITIHLSAASGKTVTVNYAASNGTATAGSDYGATSGTLTFAPGVTSQAFSVPIYLDIASESDETVLLALSSPGNVAMGAQSSATLTIANSLAYPMFLPVVAK